MEKFHEPENYEKFHERLDFIMGEVILISGNGLGAALGINQGLVNRYRKGETIPSIEFAINFCNHFGISANYLLLNIGPIKLKEIPPAEGGIDPEIASIEQRKAMAADILELENSIQQFKKKYSL